VKRASEEELMDLPLHAQAYANADFSEPNSKFVTLFSEKFPAFNGQIRACIAEPRRLLADATSPFNQRRGVFSSHGFSPARAALRSQSNAATLSSCAAGDSAMGWRL
jgi:hypothetical protein